jgi:hypothetical protein
MTGVGQRTPGFAFQKEVVDTGFAIDVVSGISSQRNLEPKLYCEVLKAIVTASEARRTTHSLNGKCPSYLIEYYQTEGSILEAADTDEGGYVEYTRFKNASLCATCKGGPLPGHGCIQM